MKHSPLHIHDTSILFSHVICIENFSATIFYGERIGIIGNNGSGKSTIIKALSGALSPSFGTITIPSDARIGYVPQTVTTFESLSGGQRFNKELTNALALDPNLLLLDEPTNHLDRQNKQSLMRMLRNYTGTIVFASHDPELLQTVATTIWHIDNKQVHIFSGTYNEYLQEHAISQKTQKQQLNQLNNRLNKAKKDFERERKRAAQSKRAHKDENDRNLRGAMKERASQTSGKKNKLINDARQKIEAALATQMRSEHIIPRFSIDAADVPDKEIITIADGSVGYDYPILHNINLSITGRERVALCGNNGSGKSTLIKAIIGDPAVQRTGAWRLLKKNDLGYLDQHYNTLNPAVTVFEAIKEVVPSWSIIDIRKHLNDFLFRTNDDVNTPVSALSGGQKARLSLAQIAAHTPKLLILDEVTNNLDRETRNHVIEVLRRYPGALLVISHDDDFLQEINISTVYTIDNGKIIPT